MRALKPAAKTPAAFITAALLSVLTVLAISAKAQTPPTSALLSGAVTNPKGEPIPDVEVVVSRDGGPPKIAMTGGGGDFVVRDLPPGRYDIDLRRPGFLKPKRFTEITRILAAGERLENLRFELLAAAAIRGKVVDDTGRPRSAYHVEALRYEYTGGRRMLAPLHGKAAGETNDLGEYRLYGLEPGEYYVRFAPSSFVSKTREGDLPAFFPGVSEFAGAAKIFLESGTVANLTDVILSPHRSHSISVKPIFENLDGGQFVDFYCVDLGVDVELNNSFFRFVPAGGGVFTGSGFGRGRYEIHVYASPQGRGRTQYARIVADITDKDLDLGPLLLKKGVEINGQISGSSSLSSRFREGRLQVLLRPARGTVVEAISATVSEDGTFELQDVPEGRFDVSLLNLPTDLYLESALYGASDAIRGGVTVRADSPSWLRLFLSSGAATVTGTVRNSRGDVGAGSTVVLIPPVFERENIPRFRVTTTDLSGSYSISGIPPGEYKLAAWEDVPEDAYLVSEFLLNFEGRATAVSLKPGASTVLGLQEIPASYR